MLYLICPERSKWFLAEAKNREELYAKNKILAYIRKQGKGAAVLNLSDEIGEESRVALYAKGLMPDAEQIAIVDSLKAGKYFNRPFSANQIMTLLLIITDGDDKYDVYDEEDT